MRHGVDGSDQLTRRDALAAALAAAGALALGGTRADAAEGEYGPFKMGLQSYSLRGYPDLGTALDRTRDLGLKYWEAYSGHLPLTADTDKLAAAKARLDDAGVQVLGYGVSRFSRDHEANRKLFEFARVMGIRYLSADPEPDSFDSLDKLVAEYKVAIGIHNHGPGHRYATIASIQKAIKDHHELIGVCNDTGHFLRSDEDPVRAVEVFGKRTYGVHLKDVKDVGGTKSFEVLGKGDLRTLDLFRALAKVDYDYAVAIEYEENPKDPIAEIKECLKVARKEAAALKA